MVAIGRALMSNPKLLLCDEISLGLAPIGARYLRAAAAILGEAFCRAGRAGHRAGAESGAPGLLLAGRPCRALRAAKDLTREQIAQLISGLRRGLGQRHHSGRAGRRLYAMFAAGLSLIFGIMRLVNIAMASDRARGLYRARDHRDARHWAAASLLIVVPLMALMGYGLQRLVLNARSVTICCRRFW